MANRPNTAYITRLVGGNPTDNPKIYPQPLANGRVGLYLLYYLGFDTKTSDTGKETYKEIRQKRTMKLFLYENPRTPEEREHNRQTTEIAMKLRYEAEQELNKRETGYRVPQKKREVDYLEYYREYYNNYNKTDKRIVKLSYNRFVDFLNETPKYKSCAKRIRPSQIDREMVMAFTDYLQKRSVGEGAHTLYTKFKKVAKYATEHDIFRKNPCEGLSIKIDRNVVRKAILSLDEIRQLVSTPFQGNDNIKRAFLFSLYTGLRWCDVRVLTFANVDYANQVLTFVQHKTEGHSANAGVQIPLNDNLFTLIGEKGKQDEKIFNLPTYEASCKAVKKWVKRAGIEKKISWHCARHSFAVNVLNNGANIKTVSSLMGHSSIAMTEKYLHAIDSLKRDAINSLPSLQI